MEVVAVGGGFEHISLESVEMGVNNRGGVRHLCFCGDRAKNLSKFLGVINGMEGSEHSRDAQDGLCV